MRLRARDVRAILFCVGSTASIGMAAFFLIPNRLVALCVVLAYAGFLASRPRLQRVIARLTDQPSWRGYVRNG